MTLVLFHCGCIATWLSCSFNQWSSFELQGCVRAWERECLCVSVAGEDTANRDADWGIQLAGWINEACRYGGLASQSRPFKSSSAAGKCDKVPAINHPQDRSLLSVRQAAGGVHGSSESRCGVMSPHRRRSSLRKALSPGILSSRAPLFEEIKKQQKTSTLIKPIPMSECNDWWSAVRKKCVSKIKVYFSSETP